MKKMQREFNKLASILFALLYVVSGCAFTTEAKADYSDLPIYIIGDYKFSPSVHTSQRIITPSNGINSISNEPVLSAIIIAEDVRDIYLTEEKYALNNYLQNGNILFFPQTSYDGASEILAEITPNAINMTPTNMNVNPKDVTAFAFRDQHGKYYTGCIIVPKSAQQVVTDNLIVNEAIENQKLITNAVGTSPEGNFNPGTGWNELTDWHKNIFAGDLTGSNWFSEWIAFYSANVAGQHYYAWAGEWSTEGSLTQMTNYVKYQSDADLYQSGVRLRSYEPKMTPDETNVSFNIAINKDNKFNFGFSVSWPTRLVDNTSSGNEYCKLTWYTGGKMARNTCTSSFVMIFKDEKNASGYTFHHYRSAEQIHSDQYDVAGDDLTSYVRFEG